MKEKIKILLLGLVIVLLGPIQVHAVPFGFDSVTNDDPNDALIGETQLFVDVTDIGGEQALFTFSNIGPAPSSIADVYFDDGSLFGIASIDNSDAGVSFSQLSSPFDLPGGNSISPAFVTTIGFSADSNPPVQPNGVDPGESLGILFDLQVSATFDEVINDLISSGLRIGIHLQGFESGGSESFVNNPSPLPESRTILLVGIGLVGFAGFSRRNRKKQTNVSHQIAKAHSLFRLKKPSA